MTMHSYPRELIAEKARLRPEDLELVWSARRAHNQLGLAYQIAFIRLTGRAPVQAPFEVLEDLLSYVAAEIGANPRYFELYAQRQPTLSVHLRKIRDHLGLRNLDEATRKGMEHFLFHEAFRLEQGAALVSQAEDYLREQGILLPARSTLRRMAREQRDRAHHEIFSRLLAVIPSAATPRLDALVEVPAEGLTSALHDLKSPPGLPSPGSFLKLVEKLERIQAIEVLNLDLGWMNNNLRRSLARRAQSSDADRIRRLTADHRYAVLGCFLREPYVETVDQAVEMHGKIITQTFRRARNQLDEQTIARRRLVREALKSFQGVARAVLDDRVGAEQLREAIFRSVSRDQLEAQVVETEQWLNQVPAESFALVVKRFQYFRRFSPGLLEHIPLRSSGHSETLLEAIELLRTMNRDGGRKIPQDAPTQFLTPKVRAAVETDKGIDRRAYECAVLTAVRDEVRRGNLWVEGSRRYRRLEDFFLPESEWEACRSDFFHRAQLPEKAEDVGQFLKRRLADSYVRFLASFPKDARVTITDEGWKLSSDGAEQKSPEEQQALENLTAWLGRHMRQIRLPDLLIEVDNELDWSRHFVPPGRRRERTAQDVCEVVASVMAYGCNIGPDTMARLTNGVSYKAIRRIADWQLGEHNLRAGLGDLVNAISSCNVSDVWGQGKISSSDGQRFLFPRKSLKATYSHQLGDYALEFYTFVADNYAPFYSTPIECSERDAAYVLDGLLYHESEIDPEEHYTDTHGYTELNFAAFAMFGERFCPRIRGLHRQWIYRIDPNQDHGPLQPVVSRKGRTIHLDWIVEHWDRIGQFFGSFASGQTTASVALKRLMGYGKKNRFYRATRELGRIFKTEFILEYLSQPALRKRIRRGLLKGEELHALAHSVHYGRLGRLDQRDFERQTAAASCLLVILAAIIYWQIREIERVLREGDSSALDLKQLSHISPIGWDNVQLYGEYQLNRRLVQSQRLRV